jgi:primosomal protein N' (replication factor Y)
MCARRDAYHASVTTPPRSQFVRVAVNAGRPNYMTFTYRVPHGREVAPGEVVHVPWGARTLQGVVTEGPTDLPGYSGDTRELEPPLADAPRLSPERLALAMWVAETYIAPPWESIALLLPPGAGEAPRTAIVRGTASTPEALSERQQALLDVLSDTPQTAEELREVVGARGFDAALVALVRRGLAERRYTLARPRGRARIAQVVRLAVPHERALAYAEGIEGRRASRRARALRALLDASGPVGYDALARTARGAPAVDTLIGEGALAREGNEVRLVLTPEAARAQIRLLSRTRLELAASALLERLAALPADEALPIAGLARDFGDGVREALERLTHDGIVRVEEVLDRRDPLRDLLVLRRPPVELVGEQREAGARIRAAIDRRDGTQMLVAGVTGSGKTEVYLDSLRHAVEQGKRGIVLVPEIALTPQTVRRFAERFPGRVGVLHSGLTAGEAFDEWHAIAAGAYDVVIGSRSAIFAPQPDLGLIVIDEAHEWTYKQQDPAPRYDARAVAERLARLTGAVLIFGTATPDAERWYAAAEGAIARIDLPRRFRPVAQPGGGTALWPAADLPEVEVVDVRGQRQLFSEPLMRALGETLDRDEQAILFLNRRGMAGYLLCPRGHSPVCTSCDVAMSVHEPPGASARLVCHQCNRSRLLSERCTECDRPLRAARAGTQRVEREVQSLFPAARVVRVDRDTTRTTEQYDATLGRFTRQEADVLVGTQMIAKGLDLPLVTLVGVVLADYSLWSGGFRAREQTFQLLAQVAGRAGRAERPGRVIIQTLAPEDRAIAAAAQYDVDGFFEAELPWRREHAYPPFARLTRLLFAHARNEYALEEAVRVQRELRRLAAGLAGVDVLGPTPPQIARVRGRYRWGLLIRADDPAALLRELELPPGWSIDVDPVTVE